MHFCITCDPLTGAAAVPGAVPGDEDSPLVSNPAPALTEAPDATLGPDVIAARAFPVALGAVGEPARDAPAPAALAALDAEVQPLDVPAARRDAAGLQSGEPEFHAGVPDVLALPDEVAVRDAPAERPVQA
jgi:hypothetical protein